MWKKQIKVLAIIAILVILGLFFSLELWHINIAKAPLTYGADSTWNLARQQMLIEENGLGYTSSRMGYPFGHDSYSFSTGSLLPLMWQKIWGIVCGNAVLALNLSYLSGFVLIAWVTFWVLRKLNIDDNIAIAMSVLYTFLPYHVLRNCHISLAFYIVVPLACYCILQLMETRAEKLERRDLFVGLILMLLSGMGGVYYAFFTCVFLCVAILYNVINKNSLTNIARCIISILLVVMGLIFAYLPVFVHWLIAGKTGDSIVRVANDIPAYALRIAHLILPIANHRITFFSELKKQYNTLGLTNENGTAALGIIFTIGFLALWFTALKKEKKNLDANWSKLVSLTVCGTVYASVGGLIEIQGLFLTNIRCSNRISVFLGFFACLAFAILLQNYLIKHKMLKMKKITYILLLLVCIGIFDQTPKVDVHAYDVIEENIDSLKEFTQKIESIDSGAAILQLPNVTYPEAGQVGKMTDYSHAILYTFSDSLKWSYGAMRGGPGSVLLSNLCDLEIEDMVRKAAEIGYGGIYIDAYGYEQEELEQLRSKLDLIIQQQPIISSNNRYIYYSLKQYNQRNNIEYSAVAVNSLLCKVSNGANLYGIESDGINEWYWSQNQSQLKIYNYADEQQTLIFTCGFRFYEDDEGVITIKANNNVVEVEVKQGGTRCATIITLEPGENTIELYANKQNHVIDSGAREVCFMVLDCQINSEPLVSYGNGFYQQETNGFRTWRWSKKQSEMTIISPCEEEVKALMCYTVNPERAGNYKFNVAVNAEETEVSLNGAVYIEQQITLKPGENKVVFGSDLPYFNLGDDNRLLCYSIMDLDVTILEQ